MTRARLIDCPGGGSLHPHTYQATHDNDRCIDCHTPVRTIDDGTHVLHYNRFDQLVNRTRSKGAGPQSAVHHDPRSPDPGATHVSFGNFTVHPT